MNSQFPFTIEEGVLFRNPKPHVRSLHAYFPSLVAFSREHLGASVVLAQAFEAADMHLVYFESRDGGKTWERKSEITPVSPAMEFSTAGRIALMADGSLVASVARHQRSPDDNGLTTGQDLAFVPTTLELYRSRDEGATWEGPERLTPPLAETSFEICSPVRVLGNGTWHWPTSTWPTGNVSIGGFETGTLVSANEGATWERWQPIYPNNELIFWESKLIPLADGRLLSTAWVHELAKGRDLANHYAIGSADACHWSAPQSTGIQGQTMEPLLLADGRVLAIYRSVEKPGIRGALAWINEAGEWSNECDVALWSGPRGSEPQSMRDQFATLKCGAPSAVLLEDGTVVVTFWAVVENVSQITTLHLTPVS